MIAGAAAQTQHRVPAFDAHLHRIHEGVNQHGARTYQPEPWTALTWGWRRGLTRGR
jgi:hypothetical protein